MIDAYVEILKDLKKECIAHNIPCAIIKHYDTTSIFGHTLKISIKFLTLNIGIYISGDNVTIVPHNIQVTQFSECAFPISDPKYPEKCIKFLKRTIKNYCKSATKLCRELTNGLC